MRRSNGLTYLGVILLVVLMLSAVAGAKTLTIHMLGYDTGIEYLRDVIIPTFEAEHGVQVELVRVTWGTRADRLITATASGMAPDIFMSGAEQLPELIESGLIHPLNEYMDAWGEIDDFYPGALGSSEYRGVRYGLPIYTSPRVTWYRKDFFSEVGLDPNHPPTNWDELISATRRLNQEHDGQVIRQGYDLHKINGGANANTQEFAMFLAQNGGDLHDPVTGLAGFNTPAGYEALEMMRTLRDTVVKPGQSLSLPGGVGNNLYRGASAIIVQSSNILADFQNPNRVPDLSSELAAMVPPPGNVQNVTLVYNDWLGVHSHSENKDLAWEFMKYFFSGEVLRDYGLAAGYQSPRRSTFMDFVEHQPLVQHVYRTLEYGIPYTLITPTPSDLTGAFGEQYRKVMANEQGTQTALEEASRQWDVLLSK